MLERLRNPLAFLVHASSTASDAQALQLREMGVPVLMGTETGLRAARHVLSYSAFQRERVTAAPVREVPRPKNLAALRRRLSDATAALDEHASKELMRGYGLTTTRETLASSRGEVLAAASAIGYPVALKTAGGDLHKTESGGVCLGLAEPQTLAGAYRDFEARLGPRVLVQEMIPQGTELLLGVVEDPQFGPMLTIGAGGIFVEIFRDVRLLPLPTT